jgi:signal peptidase I
MRPRSRKRLAATGAIAAVSALTAMGAGSSGAATPDHPAGRPFLTLAHALATGDFALACAQLSSAALEDAGPEIPTDGGRRRACAAAFASEAEALDRDRFASTRIVKVRVKPGRARVTVQTTFHDLQPRATGTAVKEDGVWKILEAPGQAHVGSLLLYRIPSSSMIPALAVGDTALVDEDAYLHARPQIGDVVVFHPPAGAESARECGRRPPRGQACATATKRDSDALFIKRIVGRPGDRIAIRRGRVIRNGVRASEPFVARPCTSDYAGCDFPRTFTVSAGRYYVLGDDRGASDDSRFWGPVARRAIVGKLARVIRRAPQP